MNRDYFMIVKPSVDFEGKNGAEILFGKDWRKLLDDLERAGLENAPPWRRDEIRECVAKVREVAGGLESGRVFIAAPGQST